jgi:hypothetical protein
MLVFAFAMISLYDHKSPYKVLEHQVNICLHHTSQDKYHIACTFMSIRYEETFRSRSKLEKPDKWYHNALFAVVSSNKH